jgi:ribosome biogenesis GTPase
MPKRNRFRAEFRKNRLGKPQRSDWTRKVAADDESKVESLPTHERVSGKGDRTRKRTVVGAVADEQTGLPVLLDVDRTVCRYGRVLSVHGLSSVVQTEDRTVYRCATRRLLKTISTDLRHVVVAGDWVWIRPAGENEGIIERVEPRKGVLSRSIRNRRQVLVANVDQLMIVGSAAEPTLKANLIDRFLVSAHQSHVRPLIVINKMDLVEPAEFQPLLGMYRQMGYEALLVSAANGWGIERLKRALAGTATAVCGQSGVGKSSLLNAIDPQLQLRTATVSAENDKGRHTTTTARLLPIASGGYVVDTPGIRQFQLWDVIAAEVAGYFLDLRPYTNHCRFPNCTHTHETDCAVKNAVADGRLDLRRYDSYCAMLAGEAA